MIEGKKVLITGGAGFIGSHLIEELAPSNDVTVLDSLDRDAFTARGLADTHRVDLVVGDVLDEALVNKVTAGQEIIIHCAAIAGIHTVVERPVQTLRVNIMGSWNVLEAAARAGDAERVVCFSTSEIFGRHASDVTETMDASVGPTGQPRYTYAVGKLAEEHLAIAYYQEQNLPTVVLRPFNVYGPGQVGEGAIRNFVTQALASEDLVISGTGSHTRAWTYVKDMVAGVVAAVSVPAAVGDHFNIGNPQATISVADLASMIVDEAGSSSAIAHTVGDEADVVSRSPRIDKAQEVLGFEPQVGLAEGIRLTVDYYRAQLS